ncbi:MAG: hypothetical protein SW833_10575 [Cyanobacteriota bacterium]|nr:hypothetical protein [Cyanobacteriota bacterium]
MNALKTHLQGRIIIEYENEQAIAQTDLDDLPTFSLDQRLTTNES